MPRTDSAARLVAAAPEEVFAALVDVDARMVWLPPSGMTARFEEFDPRPGGGYRLVLTYDDGANDGKSGDGTDVVRVRFEVVDPPRRVVESSEFLSDDAAFGGTMRITWSVEPQGEGALVTVTVDDVPDAITQAEHDAGLGSSLANLAAYVEGRKASRP